MSRKTEHTPANGSLQERLEKSGMRLTAHREHVYDVLLQKKDHPTAEEVFIRAKKGMPDISMATVYNCLDALVSCGLVRQVNQDRSATRYCSNLRKHHHFHCDECGRAYDIDLLPDAPLPDVPLPEGFLASQLEVTVRGRCPDCAGRSTKQTSFTS
jgi:Fur family peroxide stress response transcriptional regulator